MSEEIPQELKSIIRSAKKFADGVRTRILALQNDWVQPTHIVARLAGVIQDIDDVIIDIGE